MFEAILSELQGKLRNDVREFVKWVPRELLLDMDKDNIRYPTEFLIEAAKRNLLGIRFPKEFGGKDFTWDDEIVALSEIGALGGSLACLYSLVSIVGEAINKFGTHQQKEKYLKAIIDGKMFCAEALTEPRGGSDFFGATTFAKRDGNYYILNGQKRFVVGAEGADIFLVYAKTSKDAPLHKSLSTFIVERDDTIIVKHVYGLLGVRGGGTGRIIFDNTRVPVENLLCGEGMGGDIFNQMMVPERMTSAGGAVGLAETALKIAAQYSNKRKAFSQKIRNFEGVNFKIADSITKLDAAKSLIKITAQTIDKQGSTPYSRRLVSESKKFATDTAWEVINHSMQIMGGIGYTNIYPIERMLRDARLMMIWTGTNEIMNLIIQHEYYKEVESEREKTRDYESDSDGANLEGEKVFE